MTRVQMLFVLAIFAVLAMVALVPMEDKAYALLGLPLLPPVFFIGTLITYPLRARKAGQKLTSSRRLRGVRGVSRWAGSFFVIAVFVVVPLLSGDNVLALSNIWVAIPLSLVAFGLVVSAVGTQLRERGMFSVLGLVPWERVESFAWEDAPQPVLRLEVRNKQSPPAHLSTIRLVVPPEEKDALNRRLTECLQEAAGRRSIESASWAQSGRPEKTPFWRQPAVALIALVLTGTGVAISIAAPTLSALQKSPDAPPPPAETRDGRWRQDLAYLAKELPRLHPNLFFHEPRADFETAVASLDRGIASMSDQEIMLGLDKIVAGLGDGHTAANLQLGWRSSLFQRYPLRLYWFSDGLHVTGATEESRQALGARLVQIGDTDIDHAYAAVATYIAHENDQAVRADSPDYLVTPEVLKALRIVPSSGPGHFVFEDDHGERFALDLAAIPIGARVRWLSASQSADTPLSQRSDDNYWFTYLRDSGTLYVQYNQCEEMDDPTFETFTKRLFAFADNHPVRRLILDLRYNSGGDPHLAEPLLLGLKARSNLNNNGHLFVIVGRATFSAAIMNAVQLRRETHAIFVGEPTGQGPNFYGAVSELRLPNSGIAVSYSRVRIKEVKNDPPAFMPDIFAAPAWQDYVDGQDTELKAITAFGRP